MLKQLHAHIQATVEPRLRRIQFIDKRIRVLHYRMVQEIKDGVQEGIKQGFKPYVDKDGNTHRTPFTK
jgi:hypothetical protein